MASYRVVDNYLPQQQYLHLYKYMTGFLPDWKFIPYITHEDDSADEGSQFCIPVQSDVSGINDPHGYFAPLVSKINPVHMIRIKANCTLRTENIIESKLHIDYEFPCMTSIYYINTCDGYTRFEDGSRIDSVGNRMLLFPSNMKHGGTTTTNQKYRMVINFNYHPRV
tara:strand:+ start:84 stop:584 length:501 start_codon:yes stop_codon:yes gene_type:complete